MGVHWGYTGSVNRGGACVDLSAHCQPEQEGRYPKTGELHPGKAKA